MPKIDLTQDPEILLLETSSKDLTYSYRDFFSSMFIASLFTTTTKKKQFRCPSDNERILKVLYIDIMDCYSDIKK